ncbi:glycosyltransferase family 4 protein [Flammeovirga agarivorans]|uniref:Glycosyltransferase family 4 protein n=1 Tax=Flammeovirga agarivorans TaxID=2726742 RepID=A0A7X8XWW7_9BACT|nr:glycosyltransferase family 4 protein [Flammeovirga agarivorans]NLR92671.1 glycosyltransferase family 4 protein [Flammeovirga agarivorans]
MTLYSDTILKSTDKAKNDQKLNICIITHCYPPDFGAAPHQYEHMAKSFQKEGHYVSVITSHPYYPSGKLKKEDRYKFISETNENGITVRRHWLLPSQKNNSLLRLISMMTMLMSMLFSLPYLKRNKIDLIICQTPPISLPFLAILAKKRYNIPIILNVSDLWPQAMVDINHLKKSSFTYKLLHKVEKYFYKKADHIVTQSIESQEYIQQLGFQKPQIYRIGADIDTFKPSDKDLNEKRYKMVYMGVLGVAHGLSQLINQIPFDRLGIDFHIYGNGIDLPKIKHIIKEKGLNSIQVFEPILYQKVPQVLQEYDFAFISQINYVRGTLPAKLFESLSMGLPIIFHGDGEGAKIVKENDCGWVSNPNAPEELVINLKEITQSNRNVLIKKGQNARTLCTQHFDRDQQFTNLMKTVYQNFTTKS